MPLSCYARGREEEQKNVGPRCAHGGYHGVPMVDAIVCGESITTNLFVFPHCVVEVDWVLL